MRTIVCSGCGRESSAHLNFCTDCGTPLGYTGATSGGLPRHRGVGAGSGDEPPKPAPNHGWQKIIGFLVAGLFLVTLGMGMALLIMVLGVGLLFGAVDWALGAGVGLLVLLGMAMGVFRLLGVSVWTSLGWCLVMVGVGVFVDIALVGWALSGLEDIDISGIQYM